MTTQTNNSKSYILFELAGTSYAVASGDVQQMEMVEKITPVPSAPSFVDGVVFARGQVVPVVNLRARFGFERIPCDMRTRLMVVSRSGRTVGLLIDTAREFVVLEDDAIKPPPETITGLSGKYLAGIASAGERLVLVLNVDEIIGFQDAPSAPTVT